MEGTLDPRPAEQSAAAGETAAPDFRKSDTYLFVTSFPPPRTGETIATQHYYGLLGALGTVERVNLSHGGANPRSTGHFAFGRVLQLVRDYFTAARLIRSGRFHCLYFVPGTTALGQCKDWLLLLSVLGTKLQVVTHLQQGNFAAVFQRPLLGRISERLFRRVDRFIHLSRSLSAPTVKRFPLARHFFVNNPTDGEVLLPGAEVRALRRLRQPSPWRFLYISNMIREKGYLDAAEALKQARDNGLTNVRLTYAGAWTHPADEAAFREKLAEWDLSGCVELLGPVKDRQKIRELLKASDVFILPTYYPREAQPLCLIEAANAGLPLISTRHAGVPDVVVDGYNGYLVTPRQPGELAEAMRKICAPETWLKFALNSRDLFEKEFSHNRNRSDYLHAMSPRPSAPQAAAIDPPL